MTEVRVEVDGLSVLVGIPANLVDDVRVAEIVRDYLHDFDEVDRGYANFDEQALAAGLAGPMLDRELQGLRDARDQGQVFRFLRESRVLAIYVVDGDQAGIYDQFVKTNIVVDARTGKEIQRDGPRVVSALSALRRIDNVWKVYDARGFQ